MLEKVEWVSSTPAQQWEKSSNYETTTDASINLEITQEQQQTWQGFGGCFNEIGWDALLKVDSAKRESIMEKLFQKEGECGFSFCRMPMGASDYALSWYSLNETENDYEMEHFSIERDQKNLIPYIKNAQKYCPDLKIFASPWSPPTWMKQPPVYNYGTLIWEKEVLESYALYFLKFIEAYKNEGIPIEQVHIQNEPISSQKFPSCIWTGEQFAEFIGEYIGPLFEKHKIATQIWLGTLNGPEIDKRKRTSTYNHYANTVLSNEKALKYTSGISYQWAGKYAVQLTHLAWPEMPLMQSENECGDGTNTWEYAFYVFGLMHHYIINGVSSYIYWNMVLPNEGESTWGWKQNSMICIDSNKKEEIYNPEYFIMKHFSHFIKPGYKVVRLAGPWSANALCFQKDKKYIVVIRNPFKKESEIFLKIGADEINFKLKPESINTFSLSQN